MKPKVVKITSKGQITLPAKWRKQFATDNFLIEERSQRLVIQPIYLDQLKEEEGEDAGWTDVWSSERDNGGQGVPIEEVITMLQNIRREQDREIPPEAH